jgi:hypothetical protein
MNCVATLMSPQYDPTTDDVALATLAELAFFCEQRYGNVRSAEGTEEILLSFERRIPPLIDALLMRGPQVIDWLIQALQTATEAGSVLAAAIVLLDSRHPAGAEAVLAALEAATDEPKLRELHTAVQRGPIDLLEASLQRWLSGGTPRLAARAAEALAFHRRLPQNSQRLVQMRGDPDAAIRRAAWRATALST